MITHTRTYPLTAHTHTLQEKVTFSVQRHSHTQLCNTMLELKKKRRKKATDEYSSIGESSVHMSTLNRVK